MPLTSDNPILLINTLEKCFEIEEQELGSGSKAWIRELGQMLLKKCIDSPWWAPTSKTVGLFVLIKDLK